MITYLTKICETWFHQGYIAYYSCMSFALTLHGQIKLDGVVSVAVIGVKDEFYGEVSVFHVLFYTWLTV